MQEELQALIRNNTWLITYLPPDDILVASSDDNIISEFKIFLAEHFKFKDLGYPKYFLGIEIARNKSGIFISQHKYALDLVSDAGLLGCKPASTPIGFYQAITNHLVAAERVLKYLKGTVGHGLFYSAQADLSLSIFSDADWAGCPDTRRSISGFCLFLGTSLLLGDPRSSTQYLDPLLKLRVKRGSQPGLIQKGISLQFPKPENTHPSTAASVTTIGSSRSCRFRSHHASIQSSTSTPSAHVTEAFCSSGLHQAVFISLVLPTPVFVTADATFPTPAPTQTQTTAAFFTNGQNCILCVRN
ncbi:hypothetical protein SASPL_133389 [Salvia splendens]|uniref:Reverse transcriptase Ty1/copia-type domain-containing protein n=1 Tax=Salvia splendens TaxID=180675 RepID=A0A8X8X183_SALSN|nr:hypothetical protein SASPL_133389 [Salvia splendens]